MKARAGRSLTPGDVPGRGAVVHRLPLLPCSAAGTTSEVPSVHQFLT